MKKIGIYLLSGLLLVTASCVSQKRKDNTITISGAFALYPLVIQLSEEYRKENPQVRFNITGGGAGKGLADALSEVVDLGMFSRAKFPLKKSPRAPGGLDWQLTRSSRQSVQIIHILNY